ncbi:xylose isomerase [Moorella thermoacetica]|uniref:hypothetical protein n=1 Tax=Neomoorella thermoacetica TaxID=1525 RepID=UPI0006A2A9D4|nr:hypothetical protein [Moorella thermoacetica]AKX94855.1 xylose isomerase [Moorella thermoacetica]
MQDLSYQATRRSPEELIRHLQNFELNLRFSAGIWFFSGSNSRFHIRYGQEMSIEERLEKFASLKEYGLEGIEAHYPNEINEHNLPLYKDFCRDTGMKVVTVVPNLFYEEQYCYGSLSSPLPAARQSAIQRVKETLEINKELGTESMLSGRVSTVTKILSVSISARCAVGSPPAWQKLWTPYRELGWRWSPSPTNPGAE